MKPWASEELKSADLGDRRRNKRLMKLVSDLAEQPKEARSTSMWRLGSNPSSL